MSNDRSWMYHRLEDGGLGIRPEFIEGVRQFVGFALDHPECMSGDKIRCPCCICMNRKFQTQERLKTHLYKKGFKPQYTIWASQGEKDPSIFRQQSPSSQQPMPPNNEPVLVEEQSNPYIDMVMDMAGPGFDWEEQLPNADAQKFFDLLEAGREELYEGCKTYTKLSAAAQLLTHKSEANMSENAFDNFMSTFGRMLPEGANIPKTFYETKKIVAKLGLSLQKIDACPNDCMLYYKSTRGLTECSECGHPRYKPMRRGSTKHKNIPFKVLRYLPLAPRLQRLFMSTTTAKHMRWHKECPREDGVLSHPSDGEAWKHFDRTYRDFSFDPRNVRLCASADGFDPFSHSTKPYSCWPVIVTPYNLPPWMAMKQEYLFLTLLIPGPKSPGKNIDVYLRPLIDELIELWQDGIDTYDVSKKENFKMKAALMWTVNDFPAYGMLSGWSTHGKLSCPYCMSNSKSFTLECGGKPSFFDCHRQFLPTSHPYRRNKNNFMAGTVELGLPPPRLNGSDMWDEVSKLPNIRFGKTVAKEKIAGFGQHHNWVKRSIFWDLPYWQTNLIRHNLDVMHIEKNVFDNVFNTIMDVKGKTKDNVKARVDLKKYCKRLDLELREVNGKTVKPKASYTLTKEQQKLVLEWIKQLRFPDGYASNLSRCVNVEECKIYGMKSHDCHVFLERLIPIVFKNLLPDPVWRALTELSQFFRDICSSILREERLKKLEENIIVTLCTLEKIFPPAFFDSMEHLPIHLAYEARVGGPVNYRWMYPFERFMNRLKKKVKNKSRVEGSICEAYLIEETSIFCSHYFEVGVGSKSTRVERNDDGGEVEANGRLSVFTHPGRPFGHIGTKYLSDNELAAASLYVLLNCEEIEPFVLEYENEVRDVMPNIDSEALSTRLEKEFTSWFANYVKNSPKPVAENIKFIARGPKLRVHLYNGYFVNGYKFHTQNFGIGKSTMNSGVCIRGSCYNDVGRDYYGMLDEIVELEYESENNKGDTLVLFKCEWYDYVKGIKVHPRYNIVDLNPKSRLGTDDPFLLASQAEQVYYLDYPGCNKRDRIKWWAVCKTKARSTINVPYADVSDRIEAEVDDFFQEVEMPIPTVVEVDNELDNNAILVGEGGQMDEVDAFDLPLQTNQMEIEEEDSSEEDESEEEVQEVVYELNTSDGEEDEINSENTSSEEE